MKIEHTLLKDAYIITPDVFGDNRGYFFESYSKAKMKEIFDGEFIQDNQSLSTKKGVIRGLHCQAGEFSQTKLVRVVEGVVDDVIVDVRKGSPSYLRWIRVRLSGENQKQLFIPKGFLHGEKNSIFGLVLEYFSLKFCYPALPLNGFILFFMFEG